MRVSVITGAAGGIGSAATHLFSARGWSVVALDRRAGNIRADLSLTADLTASTSLQRLADEISSRYGHIDALINNAAVQIAKPLLRTTPDEWNRVFETNVTAAYLLIRTLYPLLKTARGAIVNVSSVHANATSPGMAAYAASKAALVALTRAAALELAPDGIRVNALLPGAVDTPMLREGIHERRESTGISPELTTLAARHPLGRIGQPHEIAEAILFLADSNRSSFVTGQTLIVDGGATAHLSTE